LSQNQRSHLKNTDDLSCMRILYVDDDPSLLEVSKLILETENNFEVDTTSSVDAAFEKIKTKHYDAVVSDYEMPRRTGLDFLAKLKELGSALPFILFTGKGREEVAMKALNLGADGYYNKQGSPETVYGELAHGIRLAAERAKSKSALEESEKRYRTLMEQAAEAIFIHNINGQIIDANQQACMSLGYSKKELLSMNIADIDPSVKETKHGSMFWPKVLAGQSITFLSTQNRKNGSIFSVEVTLGRTILDEKTLIIGLVRDITERKKTEKKLQESEEKFRAISTAARDAIVMIDFAGEIVYWNPAAERIFGYNQEETVGRNALNLVIPPRLLNFQSNFAEEIQNNKLTQGTIIEFTALKKDGTEFPAELSIGQVRFKDKACLLGIVRDVSVRKKAEEKLKESYTQMEAMNEKLRVIGGLTRHDVRNKLFLITSHVYMLKKKHSDQADIVEGLRKMQQAIKDVDGILDFSKVYEQLGIEELSYVDVEKAIDEAVGLFKNSPTVKIVNECQGLSLFADSFLKQIFYNLLDNSIKHGERVTKVRFYFERSSRENLKLIYEDDGIGVPDANKSKLFKIGFSTGGSTGFGLYLIKKMVEVYGWTIQENGVSGKRAIFTMSIPIINQSGKENFRLA
jgi:PAS domain S-box-containing protein